MNYEGALLAPDGVPELVSELKNVHEEMRKWTYEIQGLRVNLSMSGERSGDEAGPPNAAAPSGALAIGPDQPLLE